MCFEKRVILTVPNQCEVKTREIVEKICWHSKIVVQKESNGLRVKLTIFTYEFSVERMLAQLLTDHIPYTNRKIENGNIVNSKHLRFPSTGGGPIESVKTIEPWEGDEGEIYKLKRLLLK